MVEIKSKQIPHKFRNKYLQNMGGGSFTSISSSSTSGSTGGGVTESEFDALKEKHADDIIKIEEELEALTDKYISKVYPDEAASKITFKDGIIAQTNFSPSKLKSARSTALMEYGLINRDAPNDSIIEEGEVEENAIATALAEVSTYQGGGGSGASTLGELDNVSPEADEAMDGAILLKSGDNWIPVSSSFIKTASINGFTINSVETLIDYLNKYGTSYPEINTAPKIVLNKSTYTFRPEEDMIIDLIIQDNEGGEMSIYGNKPEGSFTSGEEKIWRIDNIRTGELRIDLNKILFADGISRLQPNTYKLTEIYAIDAFGRRSITPVTIEVVVGTVNIKSSFDDNKIYSTGEAVSVGYSVMCPNKDVFVTFEFGGQTMEVINGKVVFNDISAQKSEVEIALSVSDETHVATQYYSKTFNSPIINKQGHYYVRIKASSLDGSMVSQELSLNIVSISDKIIYSTSSLNVNKTYYADETYSIPINVYCGIEGEHTTKMWIENINEVTSIVTNKSLFEMSLLLPEESNSYNVCIQSSINGYVGNVYKFTLMATSKSKYYVLTEKQYDLQLYLTAKGMRNATNDVMLWKNKYYLNQDCYADMYNYDTEINGWENQIREDKLDGDCLYSNGEAYSIIHYQPFKNYTNKNNKEGEGITIEFAIHNGSINNDDSYTLTCGDLNQAPIKGFYLNSHMLKLHFGSVLLETPIVTDSNMLTKRGEWLPNTDEYIHIALRYDYFKKEIAIFLNGIISGYQTYSNHSDIQSDYELIINGLYHDKGITGFSELKLKFIRTYQKALTNENIVNNYIASIQYDDDRDLSIKLNDDVVPILSRMNMWGSRYGCDKDNYVTVDATFTVGNEDIVSDDYHFDPQTDPQKKYGENYKDWSEKHPVEVCWQGNSSLAYPVKNYEFIIYNPEVLTSQNEYVEKPFDMIVNGDGTRPWYLSDTYHCKTNYIDSSQCNNVICAKIADYVFRVPFNWSATDCQNYVNGYSSPFTYYDVGNDIHSRYPIKPKRLAIDAAPFWLNAQNQDASGNLTAQQFAGIYTWGLKQKPVMYGMVDYKDDAWHKNTIWRSESNGDSVHSQLRSLSYGFFSLQDSSLKVDLLDRPLSDSYIKSKGLVEGVDYYDLDKPERATMRAENLAWRVGAEAVMDFECREPKSLGKGHWEIKKNSTWATTTTLIDPKDMGESDTTNDYRWVWDDYDIDAGKPKRKKGNSNVGYYDALLTDTLVPFLGSTEGGVGAVDKKAGALAYQQHLDFIEMLRWIDKSPDSCFSNPLIFNRYVNLQAAIDYCVMAIVFYMADSLGRNLSLVQFDNRDIDDYDRALIGRFPQFYPVFYDMDTVFGTNVQGGLTTDAYVGWQYPIKSKSGKHYYTPLEDAFNNYNCGESRFFRRMSEHYGDAIARRYKDLRSGVKGFMGESYDAPLSYNYIIKKYCTEMVGRIGENLFNKDAVYKYIGTDYDSDDVKASKRKYIINSRGNKIVFMKNFLKKRLDYCDGMFRYEPEGSAVSEMTYFQHSYVGTFSFSILTSTPTYMRVSFAQNQSSYIFCDGKHYTDVNYEYQGEEGGIISEKILRIYNTQNVVDFKGFENKKLNKAKLSSCGSLKSLNLSNNATLNELEIAGCANLQEIYLNNCNYSGGFQCNITDAFFLKHFEAFNSSVFAGDFSRSKYLEYIDVRNCPNVLDLSVDGLKKLKTLLYNSNNITSLNISNVSIDLPLYTYQSYFTNLKTIIAVNNDAITQICKTDYRHTNVYPSLQKLTIKNCPNLTKVCNLFYDNKSVKVLEEGIFEGCPINDIKGMFANSTIEIVPRKICEIMGSMSDLTDLFRNCPNILDFSWLPAEYPNLVTCNAMLYKCIGLTSLPIGFLSNTPLLESCSEILSGCIGLKSLPNGFLSNIPKLKIGWNILCQCSNLESLPDGFMVNAPELTNANRIVCECRLIKNLNTGFLSNAPKLVQIQYGIGTCEKLEEIPTDFLANSYQVLEDVRGLCNGLRTVSTLPDYFFAGNLPRLWTVASMFDNTIIEQLNAGFLQDAPAITDIARMFAFCSIRIVPPNFLANSTNLLSVRGLFDNTLNIVTVQTTAFNEQLNLTDASNMFASSWEGRTSIIVLPPGFLSNAPKLTNIQNFFACQAQLQTIGSDLFANSPLINNTNRAFWYCKQLTSSVPKLWELEHISDYTGCFHNAPKLANINEIPEAWKTEFGTLNMNNELLSRIEKLESQINQSK